MLERINRAVADCLILCAYSQRSPQAAAREYIESLRRDPTWDDADVDSVSALVLGLLERLQRQGANWQGWLK